MKKYIFYLFIIASVAITSCTKNFNNLNTYPYAYSGAGTSSATSDASGYIPTIMQYIYSCNNAPNVAGWVYQIQQNFNSDIYAGYWMQPAGFGGRGTNIETNYYLIQGWDDYLFGSFSGIINPFLNVQQSVWAYPTPINQSTMGIAYTSKVMLSVRVADALGTLPYSNLGVSQAAYDSLGAIYQQFFSELDSAVLYLGKNNTSTIGTKDYFYSGDIPSWIRLANSLRLELAMRIVKVNPTLAQTQAEKAMATGNLITNNSQNAAFIAPLEAGLTTLCYTWGQHGNTVPGADVYSYLVGYNDPRLPIFLAPTNATNTASRIPTGKYCTMRLGSVSNPGDSTFSANMFSNPGTGILPSGELCSNHPSSSTFFNAAETYFLLAEAELRGWNMGSYSQGAQAYYSAGVTASMNQWSVSIGNYLTTSATPADYTDPTMPARDIKAVSTCSPKWGDASTNEGHLEQIITQKWIALWPVNSPVAWAEYRRTGYPKMFPAYYSAVPPTISWGGLTVNNARKIMLPNNEYLTNYANISAAINQYLDGTDAITTHVWWDANKSNF